MYILVVSIQLFGHYCNTGSACCCLVGHPSVPMQAQWSALPYIATHLVTHLSPCIHMQWSSLCRSHQITLYPILTYPAALSLRLQRGWGSEVLTAPHTYGGVYDIHSPILHVFQLEYECSVPPRGVAQCLGHEGCPVHLRVDIHVPRLVQRSPLSVGAPRTLCGCGGGHLPPLSVGAPRTLRGCREVTCPHSGWEHPAPSAGVGLCMCGLSDVCPLIWGSGPRDNSKPPPSSLEVPGGLA